MPPRPCWFNLKFRDFGFESLMSPWLTTKHQNSQQSPGRNFNKLRLFWKEVGFCPISNSLLSRISGVVKSSCPLGVPFNNMSRIDQIPSLRNGVSTCLQNFPCVFHPKTANGHDWLVDNF